MRSGNWVYNRPVEAARHAKQEDVNAPAQSEQERQRLRKRLRGICSRGYEGAGSPGTARSPGTRRFRLLGAVSILLGAIYLVWRALRSLKGESDSDWLYLYSIPLWTCEYLGWILWVNSVVGLWYTIDRPPRNLREMLPEEKFPSVDVFIVCYNESVRTRGCLLGIYGMYTAAPVSSAKLFG